jgi:hypothetical protein
VIPSGEIRRVVLPHQVDSSHVSGGQLEYRWPFSIHPPVVTTSSARSYSGGHSFLGHHSYDRNGGPEFKLVVTMHRSGLFARHIEFVPSIIPSDCYLPGPPGLSQVEAENLLRCASGSLYISMCLSTLVRPPPFSLHRFVLVTSKVPLSKGARCHVL